MHVLIASSSFYRQNCYRELLEDLGHATTAVSGGIECIAELRWRQADLLLLEAPLLWGGSDGVLAVLQAESPRALPVLVICLHQGHPEWFQLSRFRIDDFLVRFPTLGELRSALDRCAGWGTASRGAVAAGRGFQSVAAALSASCPADARGAAS